MQELMINPEFRDLIPALADGEYDLLVESITQEGVREAILTWNGTIIDGHHRYEICVNYNVPFETKEMEFTDDDAAKFWIMRNQLGRRNLTDFQRANIALQYKEIIREKARLNQATF